MIAAIVQARMTSSRLPGKVLLDLSGEPVLLRVVERLRQSKKLDEIIIATSVDISDDPIEALCKERNIAYVRGPLNDVLARYVLAVKKCGCDTVVRITCDSPLIDPAIVDLCIEAFEKGGFDFISNCSNGPRTFPHGLDTEVFSSQALLTADAKTQKPYDREHVTPYIYAGEGTGFKIGPAVEAMPEYKSNHRLALDYPEDYELIRKIYELFFTPGTIVDVPRVLAYLDAHPELSQLNAFRTADYERWSAKK